MGNWLSHEAARDLAVLAAGVLSLFILVSFAYAGCSVTQREASYRRCVEQHPPEDCRAR